MHTLNKAQRITRSAQRVGHSVRRKLADRYEHGHCTLLFIFQTTEPQVSRHPNDFEIALLGYIGNNFGPNEFSSGSIHHRTLVPRHHFLPKKGESVTYVSGTTCHLYLGPLKGASFRDLVKNTNTMELAYDLS